MLERKHARARTGEEEHEGDFTEEYEIKGRAASKVRQYKSYIGIGYGLAKMVSTGVLWQVHSRATRIVPHFLRVRSASRFTMHTICNSLEPAVLESEF